MTTKPTPHDRLTKICQEASKASDENLKDTLGNLLDQDPEAAVLFLDGLAADPAFAFMRDRILAVRTKLLPN